MPVVHDALNVHLVGDDQHLAARRVTNGAQAEPVPFWYHTSLRPVHAPERHGRELGPDQVK